MHADSAPTTEQDSDSTEPEGSDESLQTAGAFLCPSGCGPMLRRRCKLSCTKCGYYDSCSDFC